MLARYRVVVLIYVLAFLFAAFMANHPRPGIGFAWDGFLTVGLVLGTGFSGLWLLLCWVVLPPSRSSLG